MESSRRRRLTEGSHRASLAEHKELVATHAPRLTAAQVDYHARLLHHSRKAEQDMELNCAPDFEMSCLFRYSGGARGSDSVVPN